MLDNLDMKTSTILQEDSTLPVAEIGKKVGLSTTPCWRRIRKLEQDGMIERRVALLNPKSVGRGCHCVRRDHDQPAQCGMA